ncbi:MAG: mercury methylation corrinoid protein HgcA, partial [Methanomicrobium sp.]|nr:mercury methylation corrinoid protein HgcA [Methanomicrobium sp.]
MTNCCQRNIPENDEDTAAGCCSKGNKENAAQNTECCCSSEFLQAKDIAEIYQTDSVISFKNRLDHITARLGINRMGHIVKPGLYRLGEPGPDSEVFATANYTLSFDALRKSLREFNAWILVLETYGVNVWCAAGKGTFGTEELINRIKITNLSETVNHKKIILPRLAAPGVNAIEVLRKSGFHVIWGTIRSSDIPEFLKTGVITAKMKKVNFPVKDRMVLTPIEFLHYLPYFIIPAAVFGILGLWAISGKLILTLIAGTILFPALLYILPAKDFTIK